MKPYVQESQKANKGRFGISGFLSALGGSDSGISKAEGVEETEVS
jgi:hypothetical protein